MGCTCSVSTLLLLMHSLQGPPPSPAIAAAILFPASIYSIPYKPLPLPPSPRWRFPALVALADEYPPPPLPPQALLRD